MIVVTGASGFIGSVVVAALNAEGYRDIYAVDHIDDELKKWNLNNKKYLRYFDKKEFISLVRADKLEKTPECVIHMGACSSTTLTDAKYFEENNFQYTKILADWCLKKNVRFIYASSAATYGDGSLGYADDDETARACKPLNLYGQSKQKFDQWALDNRVLNKMAGLKFFNVFGPNEYHKGDMRSVAAKSYERVVREGKMSLFKSYKKEFADGEQKRDFIYVKDAVDIVMFFFNNPQLSGIFNVGTGKARSWNDLAKALFKATNQPVNIEYIDMPESLKKQYQYFTEADMGKLRKAGYDKPFMFLEDSIADYVSYLRNRRYI